MVASARRPLQVPEANLSSLCDPSGSQRPASAGQVAGPWGAGVPAQKRLAQGCLRVCASACGCTRACTQMHTACLRACLGRKLGQGRGTDREGVTRPLRTSSAETPPSQQNPRGWAGLVVSYPFF